jgi:hypothetical protein
MKQRNTRKLMPVMLIVLTLVFAVIGSAVRIGRQTADE